MAGLSAKGDQRYDWAYLFGAVCPARGVGAGLVLPVANGHAMNEHLAAISRKVAPGAHAVVTLDGAGWHKPGRKLRIPDNISLLHLPPYSPELNPVENVWQFLLQNHLIPTAEKIDCWYWFLHALNRRARAPSAGRRAAGTPSA